MDKGFVSLVGAGCGAADLLTLRGQQRLQDCTALVYDDLIDPAILEFAPSQSMRFYMGKRSGRHCAGQEEISAKLVELAREGHRVVRLKGGDPFVFGRGGEEILALQAAGIPYEEVPGISSAIAIPAAAGIPVTHRGFSRGLHVVTGHTAGDGLPDLAALAKLEDTLVFLMGLSRLDAIAQGLRDGGMSPSTPAAVISGGNSPHPAVVRGTLADIAEKAADILPPAVILVGKTAALNLSPTLLRPLERIRVGVTGTDSFTGKLLPALRKLGAQAIPLARTQVVERPAALGRTLLDSPVPRWVVFTSPNGVEVFFRFLRREKLDLRALSACRFAVIGPATGDALARHSIFADLCPQRHTSEALAFALADAVQPEEPVLLFRSAQGAPILREYLEQRGLNLTDLAGYDVEPVEDSPAAAQYLPGLDCITFASAGGVTEFVRRYGPPPPKAACICIGAVTARALAKVWHGTPVLARDTSAEGLVQAVLEHFIR